MILFYAFPSSLVVYRDRNSLKRKRNNIRYFFLKKKYMVTVTEITSMNIIYYNIE